MLFKPLLDQLIQIIIKFVIGMRGLYRIIFEFSKIFEMHRRIKKCFFDQIKQTFINGIFYRFESRLADFLLVVK